MGTLLAEEKLLQMSRLCEKQIMNGEINMNNISSKSKDKQTHNGRTQAEFTRPRFSGQTKEPGAKSHLPELWALPWFLVECIVSYAILAGVVVAVSPLLVIYNILKVLELLIASMIRGAHPMSGQDAIWKQDSANNRLIITSIMLTPKPKSLEKKLEEFRQVISDRMIHAKSENGEAMYPRVQWCIRPGLFQYFFEEEKNFNINKHVFLWEGNVPNSKLELEEVVSKLSGENLPENLSPWYFCVVPTNYGDNDLCVVFRCHHSVADGVSLTRFLTGKLPDQVVSQREPRKFSSKGRALLFAKAFLTMGRIFFKRLFHPRNRSVLHGPELAGVKRVVWSNATDLELIKKIKEATGTTVNDVLMACLSIAIRGYFKRRGIQNPSDFAACIPVDVRSKKKDMSFENRFAVVFLSLPCSIDGAVAQLMETKARMDEIKTSGEPIGTAWLMALTVALCPEFLVKPILSFITDKASCVLSNVPGPQSLLTIAEQKVKYLTFWPPQRNCVGIGLSIFTYTGKVFVGVQGDVALMTDPQVMIEEYSKAVTELSNAVLYSQVEITGSA